MYGQFKNFKINENLYGKSLNRDWVARGVFPIHSAPLQSLQSQFRLPAAIREMSPRCSLKRVDEDSLFLLQWGAVRSKEEREKIKTREGGEEREGTPVVPHRPPQSPLYFSWLSLLRIAPHYLKTFPGTGYRMRNKTGPERAAAGLEIEPIQKLIRGFQPLMSFWPIVMAAFEIYGKIQRLPNFFFLAFFVYVSSKMLAVAFIWSVRKPCLRLLTVEAMASVAAVLLLEKLHRM